MSKMREDNGDLATGVAMAAIDRIASLRASMFDATLKLLDGHSDDALGILKKALAETDVGKMKVWQEGEEPF